MLSRPVQEGGAHVALDAAKAQRGKIHFANVVRELVAGKGFLFAAHGEVVLGRLEEPVRLYEARWRG